MESPNFLVHLFSREKRKFRLLIEFQVTASSEMDGRESGQLYDTTLTPAETGPGLNGPTTGSPKMDALGKCVIFLPLMSIWAESRHEAVRCPV